MLSHIRLGEFYKGVPAGQDLEESKKVLSLIAASSLFHREAHSSLWRPEIATDVRVYLYYYFD